ncbi:HTH DNA binding protein [Mycobacterium phage BirdsNest]|uniref:Helix-turn-helix DNA binding domain protein n=1 Tax=Mycobacterium phage BirdsNest TaxID=2686231 RepID=A0A6B9LJ64_9CAUD|nr:HTH DNA binding protein [Mycobacterium phage BirdsNest]QHB37349.1 helix-turn-helix DNA binding domain protein [Mycobacterium phage BirdsNest]
MNQTDLLALATMVLYPERTVVVATYHPTKEHDMTDTATATRRPETYTHGLGEHIRALRLYIGLSQRDMADRMGKDRRDYQRIENGRDACPPGLLGMIEELADAFAYQVERVCDEAEKHADEHGTPLVIEVIEDGSPGKEWERLVAGRAAVETSADAPITLTMSGKSKQRST